MEIVRLVKIDDFSQPNVSRGMLKIKHTDRSCSSCSRMRPCNNRYLTTMSIPMYIEKSNFTVILCLVPYMVNFLNQVMFKMHLFFHYVTLAMLINTKILKFENHNACKYLYRFLLKYIFHN